MMAGFAVGALFFTALGFLGILLNVFTPFAGDLLGFPIELKPQGLVSLWFGMVFLLLALFFEVYRREFVPDELIHKKRRPKVVPKRDIR